MPRAVLPVTKKPPAAFVLICKFYKNNIYGFEFKSVLEFDFAERAVDFFYVSDKLFLRPALFSLVGNEIFNLYFRPAGRKLHSTTTLRQQSCQEL